MRSEQELKDKINELSSAISRERVGTRSHTTMKAARNALAWVLATGVYNDPLPSAEEREKWNRHDATLRQMSGFGS